MKLELSIKFDALFEFSVFYSEFSLERKRDRGYKF